MALTFIAPFVGLDSSNLTFASILEKTREKEHTFVIIRENITLFKAPLLQGMVPDVPYELMVAKGYRLELLEVRSEYNALTFSYWNCDCHPSSVWHRVNLQCPNCGKGQVSHVSTTLPYVEDLYGHLKWKFLVGE